MTQQHVKPPNARIAVLNQYAIDMGYSNLVASLKFILPGAALLVLLLVMVWPSIMDTDSRFHITPVKVNSENAMQQSMIVGPRFLGVTADGRPYTITARAAAPVPNQNDAINLSELMVQVRLTPTTSIVLRADKATYWRGRNGMVVAGNVIVNSDTGYRFATNLAYADFAHNIIWGDQKIYGQLPMGQFTADGFKATKTGEVVTLLGKTTIQLRPQGPPVLQPQTKIQS